METPVQLLRIAIDHRQDAAMGGEKKKKKSGNTAGVVCTEYSIEGTEEERKCSVRSRGPECDCVEHTGIEPLNQIMRHSFFLSSFLLLYYYYYYTTTLPFAPPADPAKRRPSHRPLPLSYPPTR